MKSVLDYLEETVLQFPEKEAVYDGRQGYTFRELLGISQKVGSILTSMCRRRSPVPVFMEKRAETMEVLRFYRMQMKPEDYLYGMFTSGSTGIPKLVTVSGGAAVEFAEEFISTFSFLPQDVIGNQAPFDFDDSVKDLLVSVFCGSRLVLIPSVMFATPPALLDYLCENQVAEGLWKV